MCGLRAAGTGAGGGREWGVTEEKEPPGQAAGGPHGRGSCAAEERPLSSEQRPGGPPERARQRGPACAPSPRPRGPQPPHLPRAPVRGPPASARAPSPIHGTPRPLRPGPVTGSQTRVSSHPAVLVLGSCCIFIAFSEPRLSRSNVCMFSVSRLTTTFSFPRGDPDPHPPDKHHMRLPRELPPAPFQSEPHPCAPLAQSSTHLPLVTVIRFASSGINVPFSEGHRGPLVGVRGRSLLPPPCLLQSYRAPACIY